MLSSLVLALSSFGLGALHTLEPGHGKTVVAAYLVGSRGRTIDAVVLGFVVTFTHTGIVIILGILATIAAGYFVPEQVQKILELVAGILIALVGMWLIRIRLAAARDPNAGKGDHDHPHDHSSDERRLTRKGLVALGVSGGIVPCPAALVVLLAAISQGKVLSGVTLVLVFSLGMAATLVAIGIVMVKAASLAQRYVAESGWARVVPVGSACLITLIGILLTAHAVQAL